MSLDSTHWSSVGSGFHCRKEKKKRHTRVDLLNQTVSLRSSRLVLVVVLVLVVDLPVNQRQVQPPN